MLCKEICHFVSKLCFDPMFRMKILSLTKYISVYISGYIQCSRLQDKIMDFGRAVNQCLSNGNVCVQVWNGGLLGLDSNEIKFNHSYSISRTQTSFVIGCGWIVFPQQNDGTVYNRFFFKLIFSKISSKRLIIDNGNAQKSFFQFN